MGYTTDFEGKFNLNKELRQEHKEYLIAFSNTRRMKRDSKVAENLPDPLRDSTGLPIGEDGAYFVGGGGQFGQGKDESILGYNTPPGQTPYDLNTYSKNQNRNNEQIKALKAQPGLWCQWVPSDDSLSIEWNGGEKFYHYTEWINYLIEHFLNPWGYVLNGKVKYQGEDMSDRGEIIIENNEVKVLELR